MLKQLLTIFLALTLTANCMHLQKQHKDAAPLSAGKVKLIADNGELLNVCTDCGPGAYPDSASLGTDEDAWTLEVVGDQVAFKGSNGKYLSRCNNCWDDGAYPDSVFVHVDGPASWSLWTPVLQ